MKTKDQLIKAMYELLQKYPIEKITVDMIIEYCDLSSRTSFYRYFQDKYQLMAMCYISYEDKLRKEFVGQEQILEKTLQFMFENKKTFENMFKSEGQDSFVKFLYADYFHKLKEKYMKARGVTELTVHETYYMELYLSGVVNCLDNWVKKGMDISPKEMSDIIIESMPDMLITAIKSPTA